MAQPFQGIPAPIPPSHPQAYVILFLPPGYVSCQPGRKPQVPAFSSLGFSDFVTPLAPSPWYRVLGSRSLVLGPFASCLLECLTHERPL